MKRQYLLFFTLCTIFLSACGSSSSNKGVQIPEPPVEEPQPSPEQPPEPAPEPAEDPHENAPILSDLVDFPIGIAIPAHTMNSADRQFLIERYFNQITAENIMKPYALHPNRGQYTFGQADNMVNYALDSGMTVHGHVLVWHSQIPGWMNSYGGDWEAMLDEHVTEIAGHFEGRVLSWDVVNEAFMGDGSYRGDAQGSSVWYSNLGEEFIERAFLAARAVAGGTDLYYNDYNLSANDAKLDAVIAMAEDFLARDIPIDGIGFQMHVHADWPSTNNIRGAFQKVVDLDLKVKITELDIPTINPYGGSYHFPNNYNEEFTDEIALAQRIRFCEVVTSYMEVVPEHLRGGISVWGLYDSDSWLIGQAFGGNHPEWPLLFNDDGEPKEAFYGVADALTGQPCS